MFSIITSFFVSGEWRMSKPHPLFVWNIFYDFIPLDQIFDESVYARPPPGDLKCGQS